MAPRRAVLLGPCLGAMSGGSLRRELAAAGCDLARDLKVGVDLGALQWLKLGVRPDVVVGDWDSLGRDPSQVPRLRGVPFVTLPRDKDRSDLFYGLALSTFLGARELVAFGVTGGRADHHLAALQDLGAYAEGAPGMLSVRALGSEAEYQFVSPGMGNWKLSGEREGLVSVFAWNGPAEGVTLRGFEYGLQRARLLPSSHGLSNRRKKRASVKVRRGLLLVVAPR